MILSHNIATLYGNIMIKYMMKDSGDKSSNSSKIKSEAENEYTDVLKERRNENNSSPETRGLRIHVEKYKSKKFHADEKISKELYNEYTTEKFTVFTEMYSGFDSAWRSGESYPSVENSGGNR